MKTLFLVAWTLVIGMPAWVFADRDLKQCMQALEQDFFQADLVYKAFSFYNIPQGLWVPLYLDLQQQSQLIDAELKRITANMVPNPIEYPYNADEARKLLKSALRTAFLQAFIDTSALFSQNAFYIGSNEMHNMFDYIYGKQHHKFIECFGPEKPEG